MSDIIASYEDQEFRARLVRVRKGHKELGDREPLVFRGGTALSCLTLASKVIQAGDRPWLALSIRGQDCQARVFFSRTPSVPVGAAIVYGRPRPTCPECKALGVVRNGLRRERKKPVQAWLCTECSHQWREEEDNGLITYERGAS